MTDPGGATVITAELGGPLPFPLSNDTTRSSTIVAEGASTNLEAIPTGIVNLGSYRYSTGVVLVSLEVLQDTTIDVANFIADQMGQRNARALANHWVNGTGSSEPTGLVYAALASGCPTVTAVGSSTNDGTSAGGNTIGSDDLVTVMHSCDPLYRMNGAFLMHDQTVAALMRVLEKYGRPLFQTGVTVGERDRLYGRKFFINQYMDELQTTASSPTVTKNTIVFGDLSKYIIRRVREMLIFRLSELYMVSNGGVGYVGCTRYDANLLDAGTHPVSIVQNVF